MAPTSAVAAPAVVQLTVRRALAVNSLPARPFRGCRVVHFSVVISDKPGGLAALMGAVADERASVKDIVHERAWLDDDVQTTEVQIVAETMGQEHVKRLHARLSAEMDKLESLILRWGSRELN
eukprot:CAMPEP_0177768776 /NCGR_PEP_ID=MMETSP0491_2-20121128/9919_1 /TAXON_ID=63592 /ORGANISM="Tetraselmis chuii, Strain PLY429" /LENGTH=122 /DNA_ID=CAMNT_0019285641 /DNA_START=86 /DNA_END=455 /DNA_ORIENTATION=-